MTHPTTTPSPQGAPLTPAAPGSPAGGGAAAAGPLAPLLAWLVQRAALDDEARAAAAAARPDAFAPGAADPEALVDALLRAGNVAGALRVVASALPPREGVWWAWLAARHAAQAAQARADAARSAAPPAAAGEPPPLPPPTAQHAALAAVERWVSQPTDDHRRAAWDAAQVAGLESPAGCVAAAVFFTGGSVTPPHGPFVPPPAGVHVIMVSTAALLAAVATDPGRLAEVAGAFASQGAELVRRLGGWEAAAGVAKQTYDTQAYEHAEASKPPVLPGTEG